MRVNSTLLGAGMAALVMAPAPVFADEHEEDELEFDEAHVFFELNNTDGDLGIHALIDGDPWKRLNIMDQRGKKVLSINVRSRLRRQGLTELFFESAEPTFDELSPEAFFDRFPPGTYEIEGVTLEGDEIVSETEITHRMPEPPVVNTFDFDKNCDDEEFVELEIPVAIGWDPVDSTHPDLGESGDITIYNYEVVVETEFEIDGEEFASVFSVILPPGVTSMTIPEEFLAQGEEFKYEVLAREKSFNQTATESCFVLEGADD